MYKKSLLIFSLLIGFNCSATSLSTLIRDVYNYQRIHMLDEHKFTIEELEMLEQDAQKTLTKISETDGRRDASGTYNVMATLATTSVLYYYMKHIPHTVIDCWDRTQTPTDTFVIFIGSAMGMGASFGALCFALIEAAQDWHKQKIAQWNLDIIKAKIKSLKEEQEEHRTVAV